MDIKNLISETKARFNHNLAKSYLKEKYQNKLIFTDQGGLWKATPELIAFASNHLSTEIILVDAYENPILLDKAQFLSKMIQVYNDAAQEYLNEWNELKKQR